MELSKFPGIEQKYLKIVKILSGRIGPRTLSVSFSLPRRSPNFFKNCKNPVWAQWPCNHWRPLFSSQEVPHFFKYFKIHDRSRWAAPFISRIFFINLAASVVCLLSSSQTVRQFLKIFSPPFPRNFGTASFRLPRRSVNFSLPFPRNSR